MDTITPQKKRAAEQQIETLRNLYAKEKRQRQTLKQQNDILQKKLEKCVNHIVGDS